jgi:hypothetical protein
MSKKTNTYYTRLNYHFINLFVAPVTLFIFLLAMPDTSFSSSLERTCKGAEMIQYEIDGKKYTHTEPFNYSAKGISEGAIPSPVKARERACRDVAKKAYSAAQRSRLLSIVCTKHPNSNGNLIFMGGIGRSEDEEKTYGGTASPAEFQCKNGELYSSPLCGDGKLEGTEECDDGANNSDTSPNACRTDCILPRCGDSVIDRREQCDSGVKNSDEIPGACRTNCKSAYCGDEVLDISEGEMCDDGNSDAYDGCHQCKKCVQPKDNLIISSDTQLCAGTYTLRDPGNDGVIRVIGNDITLDCRGSRLTGSGQSGTGILITGSNVVLRGCTVSGFGTGIEIRGQNAVIFDNEACDNSIDFKKSTDILFPTRNTCTNAGDGWKEGGKTGCSSGCR